MKTLFVLPLVLALAMGVPGRLTAEPVSKAERNRLLDHLKRSQRQLEEATSGLSAEQWNFKPGPDRWSIAECYEHIAAVEDFLFDLATEKALKTPAHPEKKDAEKQKKIDAELPRTVVDRTNRVQAIEPLRPTNRYRSAKGSQEHLAASRKRTLDFAKNTKEDLRSHFWEFPAPALKEIDAYQWLLFLSGHTQRHTAQILEVKADSNFAKQ